MALRVDADELRVKIQNYKRTRQTAVGPIRAWCDRLIRDAEEELQQWTGRQQPLPLDRSSGEFSQRRSAASEISARTAERARGGARSLDVGQPFANGVFRQFGHAV